MAGASIKPDWKTAIAEGRMAVVSSFTAGQRLTRTLAAQRNESLAHLSDTMVVAHAPRVAIWPSCWQAGNMRGNLWIT